MPDLEIAVKNLIEAGYSDADILTVVDKIKWETSKLVHAGKSDEEIEGALNGLAFEAKGQSVPLFGSAKTAAEHPANKPAVSPGMVGAMVGGAKLTPKEQAASMAQAQGLEEPSFASELANPINLLTGGVNSVVSRALARPLANTVLAKTPGVAKEAINWQTMGLSNVPEFAKNVYQGYKAIPKTMAEKAAALEASGAKMVPGTTETARHVGPEIMGKVTNTGRQVLTTGKGTVGSYSDDIVREIERRGGTPLDIIEQQRQSPGGALALKQQLAEEAAQPDPQALYNINNSSLNYLEGQLERVTNQANALTKSVGSMRPNSRAPANNIINRLNAEAQTIRDEITQLRTKQTELLPVVVQNEQARRQATDIAIREEETVNVLLKGILEPPISEEALPHGPVSKKMLKEIEEETLRRGREFLNGRIEVKDFDVPPVSGFFTGVNDPNAGFLLPIQLERDRLAKLSNKITLDVGSNIRLEDGNIGKIAGMRTDGAIRVIDKKGKEVIVNPVAAQTSIIKNIAGEPEIINNQLRVGRISSNGDSGLTDRAAFAKLDAPGLTKSEVQAGKQLSDSIIASKANGLSSLNNPVKSPVNAQNARTVNADQQGVINPSIPGQNASMDNLGPNAGKPTHLRSLANWKPTKDVALDFEIKSGVPVFTKLYRYGREASDNYMQMKLDWSDRIDRIFKKEGLLAFTKGNKIEHAKISELLEKLSSNDVGSPPTALAAKLGGSVKNVKVAVELRKLYDEAAGLGSIDPAQFLQYYSPRRSMPDEPLFQFLKRKTLDYEAFFQHPRTGNLMPREDNALLLAHKYFDSWARTKHLNTWYKDTASPMINNAGLIPNETARNYFTNYTFDVMRYPRQSMVEANDRLYTLVNNTIGHIYGNPTLADDLLKRFGEERMAEVFGAKLLSLQYKMFLGYRPLPAIRNATQRIFAIPFLQSGRIPFSGEGNLARGRALLLTAEGREQVKASGIAGTYQELHGVAQKVGGRLLSPMHGYNKVELVNRGSTYLPIHNNVLNDFKSGKKIDEVAKHVNLHLYPKPIQDEFKRMYTSGMVRDVREGTVDNAAHFLGDWAQLITQFPYEKGGGPEIFRRSPLSKQMGVFQSWSLFTADYLGNMALDVVKNPIEQRQKFYGLAKMFAYYELIDMGFEHGLGIEFHSSPRKALQNTFLGAPLGQVGEGILKIASSTAKREIIGERNEEYKWLDKQTAEGLGKLKSVAVPGIIKDVNKMTGEESIIDSIKKVVGVD